jgi:protein SCO1
VKAGSFLPVVLRKIWMMKNKWILFVGFFALLFAAYYLVVFSQTDIAKSSLPVISDIKSFSFTDQNGKTITNRDIDGKVYVSEFFFTTCKSICPRMNANMRRVYDMFKDNNDFMILSHTCMPETDSVPVLKNYETKMLTSFLQQKPDGSYRLEEDTSSQQPVVLNKNWHFVTGNKTQLYNMARHSYIIDNNKTDTAKNIADEFIHTQLFSLVDKQQRVRGIYDGLKEAEVQKMLKDIKALLRETHQNRSLN